MYNIVYNINMVVHCYQCNHITEQKEIMYRRYYEFENRD
jgi:hypothetical protein